MNLNPAGRKKLSSLIKLALFLFISFGLFNSAIAQEKNSKNPLMTQDGGDFKKDDSQKKKDSVERDIYLFYGYGGRIINYVFSDSSFLVYPGFFYLLGGIHLYRFSLEAKALYVVLYAFATVEASFNLIKFSNFSMGILGSLDAMQARGPLYFYNYGLHFEYMRVTKDVIYVNLLYSKEYRFEPRPVYDNNEPQIKYIFGLEIGIRYQ